jgi:hypothetical protein
MVTFLPNLPVCNERIEVQFPTGDQGYCSRKAVGIPDKKPCKNCKNQFLEKDEF